MRVKVTRPNPSVPLPVYGTPGLGGVRPRRRATTSTSRPGRSGCRDRPGDRVPDGHFLAILARSSTPLKRGLVVANGVGVDRLGLLRADDEVKMQVLNVTDATVTVARGDRIAQAIVLPAPRVEFEEVETTAPSRGGFGSTGR